MTFAFSGDQDPSAVAVVEEREPVSMEERGYRLLSQ
jgi:hypothetical protein